MAFGLLTSEEIEMRLMKNLTITNNDLHAWMKLLSKDVIGPVMILSDCYWLQNLKDESCSCRTSVFFFLSLLFVRILGIEIG